MDKTILLINQDRGLLATLKLALEHEGFSVITAREGKEGMRKAYQNHPQAIILDVMADKIDGWTMCQQLRQVCDTPILILSAASSKQDIVKGLSLGADDYVTKTCNYGELTARIRALLRRRGPNHRDRNEIYDDGTLGIDLWSAQVVRRGKTVHLTPTESRLFMYLVRKRDRIVPHKELLVHVWGHEYAKEKQYLALYIRYLRQKLEDDPATPRYIRTRWSVGYYFSGENASSKPHRSDGARMPHYDQPAALAS